MTRKGKRTGSHGGKGKGHGGTPRAKKKGGDQLEGAVAQKVKGGATLSVPVSREYCIHVVW